MALGFQRQRGAARLKPVPSPTGSTIFGVCATLDASAADLKSWVVPVIRLDCSWSGVQPQQGVWDWSGPDRIAAWCAEAGAKWLPIACYGTPWACNGQIFAPPTPDHVADYIAFCQAIVQRYPNIVGLEIWNEPNMQMFWDQPDAARYVDLYSKSNAAVMAVRPGLPVIGGAVADIDNWRTFISALVVANAPHVSVHPYIDLVGTVKAARQIAGSKRGLWVTEVGASANLDDATRTSMLKSAHSAYLNQGVNVAFAYSWNDPQWALSAAMKRAWL